MAINIESEQIVTLTEATKAMPSRNGRRPAISTLWRWCRKGINGVRLDYARLGRSIVTSREALGRFFNALADADVPLCTDPQRSTPPIRPTPAQRQRQQDDADRILTEAGL